MRSSEHDDGRPGGAGAFAQRRRERRQMRARRRHQATGIVSWLVTVPLVALLAGLMFAAVELLSGP